MMVDRHKGDPVRNAIFRAWPVFLLILGGCGGGTPATNGIPAATPTQAQATTGVPAVVPTNAPTTGSSSVDACSLLTVAEVAAAAGEPLDLATPGSDSLYSYCTYTGSGSDDVRTWVIRDAATSSSVLATMKINNGEPVSGVGDEAWWSTDSFQPGLYILKGGLLAYVSGSVFGPEDSIIQLGKLLVSRM
jgi:hypothetical protein